MLQERPPPVPPSRPYTVSGSKKITFPQSRIMKHNYLGMYNKNNYIATDILNNETNTSVLVSPKSFML